MYQINALDAVVFITPPVASAVSLAALHWFPWNSGARPPGRVLAYTLGTAVTVGYPIVAMGLAVVLGLHYGEMFWAALLAANALASGASVAGAYWVDAQRAVTLDDVSEARRAQSGL